MSKNNHHPKKDSTGLQQQAAANVIREKLSKIYNQEPDVKEEIAEVQRIKKIEKPTQKHHKYLEKLSKSGASLAEIKKSWHDYYNNLSDSEKHRVWSEFYEMHEGRREQAKQQATARKKDKSAAVIETKPPEILPVVKQTPIGDKAPKNKSNLSIKKIPKPNVSAIKKDLLKNVKSRSKKTNKKSHFRSLIFGLGMGSLVVFILLFSFFNERFVAPFIRPSQNVSATSIIVDPNQTGNVGPEPKIIIPKINVEAPVVYDEPRVDEKIIQKALERGVVHFPITPNPGENGNSVIVGHSSSNILNSGKYKFAFLLLKSLDNDDTFFVHKDGKRYVYKVYNKFVTSPTDVSVLDPPSDRKAIMTLITCDPPGLSTNRLIIQAEQIFPEVSKNTESSVDAAAAIESLPDELPSNSVSLWQRIRDWF